MVQATSHAALSAGLPAGESLFQALTQPPVAATVQDRLRRFIVEQGLRPGARLPSETDLAATLGSTRLLVREALLALQAVGLLESRAGSGWYVRPFDVSSTARTLAQTLAYHPHAPLDLYTIRLGAEVELVRGLAGRADPRDLDALDDVVARMRQREARGELFGAEDREFHLRLTATSGNQLALALVDLFWGLMEALYERGFPPPTSAEGDVAGAHAAIVEALRQGDGATAAEVLRTRHETSQARFARWQAEHAGSLDADGSPDGPAIAVHQAMQAALLWPGVRRR
jgi:DNA-binding FadR family transcriptional regulator